MAALPRLFPFIVTKAKHCTNLSAACALSLLQIKNERLAAEGKTA